jgi:hypothetical protein
MNIGGYCEEHKLESRIRDWKGFQFLETLSYQEQQLMPRVIRLGKSKGTLKSYLEWDAENKRNIHILEAVSA